MRLPITDKFLWDIYNAIEGLSDFHHGFAAKSWTDILYPEVSRSRHKYGKKMDRKKFSRLVYYLKKNGYIKIKNLENKQGVLLTQKGNEKILKIKLKLKNKKERSDKKWQMLIFDIPEKKRFLRNILRENLVLLGYEMLQQSVWVSPFDVLKETEDLIRRYELDSYIKLFLIEEI